MKIVIYISGLLGILFIISCSEPNAEDILKKSYEKCQSIENGYYEMTSYMKYMSNNDTTSSSYTCYFKKLADDSIYSSAFHYQHYYEGEYAKDVLYTGDDFVNYSRKDSTGEIMSKSLWANDIKSYSHNYKFYSPLTTIKSNPLPNDSAFIDNKHVFEYIGEDLINNISCYHVKMNTSPDNDSTDLMQILRIENNFWISKKDYIPIQYSVAYDILMNGDTMYQFSKDVLTKYELNNLNEEEENLNLSSIPSYISLKDYKPQKSPELLSTDTFAPDWTLVSLNDETLKLSDLKGSLVLIDFFYKSCYPCMLALPALQDLHEQYYDKGLRVIGINPYDTKEKNDIDVFLKNRGITYTVLLDGKDVANEYHVSSYPTIYIIDKEGKILHTQVGYGAGLEKEFEKIITQNL
ncbi:MAG: TlpA disulfide reductase family protein [Bacteroidales bacterium]|jgi:peroxiredoxin|nr:TlpA disulfide reductase family protein [Bacteroidales bacterium]